MLKSPLTAVLKNVEKVQRFEENQTRKSLQKGLSNILKFIEDPFFIKEEA